MVLESESGPTSSRTLIAGDGPIACELKNLLQDRVMDHPSSKTNESIWEHFQNENAQIFGQSHPRHSYLMRRAKRIHQSFPVLNIGSGDGQFERLCLSNGIQIHSLDPSAKTIEKLVAQKIPAQVGSITKIPYPDSHFSVVVASEVLEHLSSEDLALALKEIKRILKPSGVFIGTVPYNEVLSDNQVYCPHCHQQFHRWGHVQSFTQERLESIFSKYFGTNIYTQKRSFVDWGRKTVLGFVKSLVRWILGRMGQDIASPHLYFELKKD